jgi:pSer/pThr/pTyr-binding forkhead associated (FHA) protein
MNGSYINGQRVRGSQPLADGDTVQLGRVVLQFALRPPA